MIDAIPLLLAPEGYQISRSVRLRSSASAYLNRTFTSAGNRKTWTYSIWVKLGSFAAMPSLLTEYSNGSNQAQLAFRSSGAGDDFQIRFYDLVSGSFTSNIYWAPLYRDPSAWYHVVFAADTTQATNTNRLKLYVNGVQITATTSATYPSQNTDLLINLNAPHFINENGAGGAYGDGYRTEINFIDGQALTPASFGETNAVTGVWQPKRYTGTYGTNGFYLNFSNPSAATAAAIGADYSGNGNNWTPNNISLTAGVTYDSMIDVPTPYADGGNGRGNYCVLNPLDKGASITVQDGNLTAIFPITGAPSVRGTVGMTTGKWYWEFTCQSGNNNDLAGISTQAASLATFPGGDANGWSYYSTGQKYTNGAASTYGASYTSGDVVGVAFDADTGSLTFYKNGTTQGTAFTGLTSGPYFPAHGDGSGSLATQVAYNFGQRPFAYTPPTGFKALNTLNLPTPTILKGNQYFDATLYTGNGSTQSIVNAGGFQPDLVWMKQRGGGVMSNVLVDAVRGVTKYLSSDQTSAETTDSTTLTALNTNGFSLGSSVGINANATTYVGWQWREGATQGFDIVTFTGSTGSYNVNHSLGVAPKMIIYKDRAAATGWVVMHASLANMTAAYLLLNSTAAVANLGTTVSAPTSTTFGCSATITNNGDATVAYLFSEVAGFSRMGSYTGNGSADGPFVFCGFRPRFVLIKRTDTTGNDWAILDSSRGVYNPNNLSLAPSLSAAESSTAYYQDFVSNGFKIRDNGAGQNASGGTYIFAAFAEVPFKNALAR